MRRRIRKPRFVIVTSLPPWFLPAIYCGPGEWIVLDG